LLRSEIWYYTDKMFYILRNTFTPNSASSNRAMAYYRAMDSMGVNGTIVILQPDANNSKIEDNFSHLKVEYCWNGKKAPNKLFRRISFYLGVYKFLKRLKPGDKVYVYGSSPCIHKLVNKKDVETFLEVTEHPEVYPLKTRFWGNTPERAYADCRKLKGLFVISTNLKGFYIQSGVPENKIHIINMIVDASRFDRLVRNTGKRYVCYCGNGNNRKDKVDELIKSFKALSSSFPDVELVIVGPQKQVYKGEKDNVELVKELGLSDRVTFTGTLPADRIPQILVNAEVLVLTRPNTLQNRAGFATKLGEYLASGTLVITTTVGDIPLFLNNWENALLVTPGSSAEFEVKLAWALSHPESARRIGMRGREVALQSFDSKTETEKMMNVIMDSSK